MNAIPQASKAITTLELTQTQADLAFFSADFL
jgi:hypothetical protein